MNTPSKSKPSHLARLLLGASLFAAVLAPASPAKAATQEYWVNLILTRGPGISDQLWQDTWTEFRDVFLPSFQSGLPGRAQFKVFADNQVANLYLVNAPTTNFTLTRQLFQSIPSMLPVIPEMSVSIDGPYLGDPPPLADLSINGRGRNAGNTRIRTRVGNRPHIFRCGVTNRFGEFNPYEFGMGGTVFNRRYCDLRIRDYRGHNVYATLKAGRTITPKVNAPGIVMGRVAVGKSSYMRVTTVVPRIVSAPVAELAPPRDRCIQNFTKRR